MKRIKYILICFVVIISLTSCKKYWDEWLDEPKPDGIQSVEDYYATVREIDKLMTGAYSAALGFGGAGLAGSAFNIAMLEGDFVAPYAPNYSKMSGDTKQLYQRKNSISDWNDHARVLQYCSLAENICNRTIKELTSDKFKDDPDINTIGKRLLGEAYCFRALINFEYTRYFGKQYHSSTLQEKAWLYRREPVTNWDNAQKNRETINDSYKYLIEDCKKAIENLPLEFDANTEMPSYSGNRFNKDVAKALLAQIYFQMNDFVNCKKYIDDLLGPTAGSLSYYPLADTNDFPDKVFYRFGSEWFGRSKNQEVIFAFCGATGTNPTNATIFRIKAFIPAKPLTGSRSTLEGDGIMCMSKYFKNYVKFDTTKDLRYKKLIDPIKGTDSILYWWPLKFTKTSGYNITWFRSAEFVLMRAECNARLGNDGDAIKDLDLIRKRANLPAYASAPDNTGNLLNDIIRERAREMFLEKYRIWELLRLGAIDGTPVGQGDRLSVPAGMNGIDALFYGSTDLPWNSNFWVFPVPSTEYLYNTKAQE